MLTLACGAGVVLLPGWFTSPTTAHAGRTCHASAELRIDRLNSRCDAGLERCAREDLGCCAMQSDI